MPNHKSIGRRLCSCGRMYYQQRKDMTACPACTREAVARHVHETTVRQLEAAVMAKFVAKLHKVIDAFGGQPALNPFLSKLIAEFGKKDE